MHLPYTAGDFERDSLLVSTIADIHIHGKYLRNVAEAQWLMAAAESVMVALIAPVNNVGIVMPPLQQLSKLCKAETAFCYDELTSVILSLLFRDSHAAVSCASVVTSSPIKWPLFKLLLRCLKHSLSGGGSVPTAAGRPQQTTVSSAVNESQVLSRERWESWKRARRLLQHLVAARISSGTLRRVCLAVPG